MLLAAHEGRRRGRSGVEMRRVWLGVRVEGAEHALAVRLALEDVLPVREQHLGVAALAQGAGLIARGDEGGDELRELIALRALERGAQAPVAVLFLALEAPLAAVVDAGDTRMAISRP